MATKTFKIGLSNTDKQNMAQDVYERLLALTFPEYDSAETYSVGDFVVYNDQLYKCIGSTSGEWDNTKWQLATLNDLLTDIEDAVQFVNDKANVDGNYPTLTVGLADNLTPYGEDSGAEQENPFISNGTGTNNNTEIVTVGDYALFKEKQGHTLVVNQLANLQNNEYSFLNHTVGQEEFDNIFSFDAIAGHKYLLYLITNDDLSGGKGQLYLIGSNIEYSLSLPIVKTLNSSGTTQLNVALYESYPSTSFTAKNVICIDITSWEQSIIDDLTAHPDHLPWYYNGSLAYNTGSLVNANGVKLVSTGRNLWDEEWELGSISYTTGQNESSSSRIRSKNYIGVTPNTDYYFKNVNSSTNYMVLFYDKNKNYLYADNTRNSSRVYTIPSDCFYIRFWLNVNTYNNNITISPYYTPEQGGEGYDEYYPYEEPYVVETGNEVLRQAGSVKDYKEPNGTIHRLVGVVDLGTLDWTYVENDTASGQNLFRVDITNRKVGSINFVSSKYENIGGSRSGLSNKDKAMATWNTSTASQIAVRDDSYTNATTFKTAMSGVYLFYELTEPTTEQGTPFAENLPINDYGMLYWLDSSNNLIGIPQGCKIFYPVNYKGFVDDVYARTEGDAGKLVIQSELASDKTELQGVDTQLLNAIGGTLRQCLCLKENSLSLNDTDFVDLGSLSWQYSDLDGTPAFTARISNATTTAKTISTKYEVQDGYQTTDKSYTLQRGDIGTIWVIDNSYTNVDDFVEANKGTLVAYEKASS